MKMYFDSVVSEKRLLFSFEDSEPTKCTFTFAQFDVKQQTNTATAHVFVTGTISLINIRVSKDSVGVA